MKKERKERKIIKWLGDSLDELRTWPKSVTEESGTELLAVQEGRNPSDWKPMTTVGPALRRFVYREQYRVLYVATFAEAVYVIHAFQKKTQKTSQCDLDLAKKRYKELLNFRKEVAK